MSKVVYNVDGFECRECGQKYTLQEFIQLIECTNCYKASEIEDFRVIISKAKE